MIMEGLTQKLKAFFIQRNQPVYSRDWFSKNIVNWDIWLCTYKRDKNLRFLEIGCYEGRSTRYLLENILTHPSSRIYCIDTFEGSMEHQENGDEMSVIKQRFFHNIRPYRKQVSICIGASQEIIRNNPHLFSDESFDFIYIDGSHKACDVIEDAILYFRTLKKNGIMIFDDYEWDIYQDQELNPRIAIDAWLACFAGRYELIHKGYQVCIRKIF